MRKKGLAFSGNVLGCKVHANSTNMFYLWQIPRILWIFSVNRLQPIIFPISANNIFGHYVLDQIYGWTQQCNCKAFFKYGPTQSFFKIFTLLSFLQRLLQQTFDNYWAFPHHVDWACLHLWGQLSNGRESWEGFAASTLKKHRLWEVRKNPSEQDCFLKQLPKIFSSWSKCFLINREKKFFWV